MDVTDPEAVQRVVDGVAVDYGSIDILINNAGVNTLAYREPIDRFPKHEWDRILSVDMDGPYVVSHAVIPHMRKKGTGRIVNIASVAGIVPLRLQSAFVAAKAGGEKARVIAVENPIQYSVLWTSLSMVLGTATIGIPC